MRNAGDRKRVVLVMAVAAFAASGCSRTQQGAAYGAAGGALLGQALGRSTEATLLGAGLGAAVGHTIARETDRAGGCGCGGPCPHRRSGP